MIDQFTVQKIFDTVQIVDIVSEFVTLKRRGVNYIGICPFHNEKTPSFIVSPAKGIYKCFGCGAGGNAVNFIMNHEQLEYVDALKFIAKKYNIEVKETEQTEKQIQQKNKRESLMVVSSFAQKDFENNLFNTSEGKNIGLSYFKERGFREDIIKKFQLGYCLNQRDGFTKSALNKGYKEEFLVETGLTIKRESNLFDRFRGRVIFPIHGIAGRVIAFGGRTLQTDKKIAKYLNSPESDIYHKSNVLYGIYQAKKSIIKQDRCFLVEGYTDVISFHQSGIENVVASSGTSLTTDQIRLIKRFTNNITVIYDGDPAGIKASLRGIDLILEQEVNVKVLLLPEGEDPDSISKKMSAVELQNFIAENEMDFIHFKTNLLLDEIGDDPVQKARLIKDIVNTISIIPDAITRSVYVKECSELIGVEEKALHTEINKLKFKATSTTNYKNRVQHIASNNFEIGINNYCQFEEYALIRLILLYNNTVLFEDVDQENKKIEVKVGEFIINDIRKDGLESSDKLIQKFFDEYFNNYTSKDFNCYQYFISHQDIKLSKLSVDIVSDDNQLSKLWTKNDTVLETEEMKLSELVPKAIYEYKNKKVLLLIKDNDEELLQAQKTSDNEKMLELLQKKINLNRIKTTLAKELGDRIIVK